MLGFGEVAVGDLGKLRPVKNRLAKPKQFSCKRPRELKFHSQSEVLHSLKN